MLMLAALIALPLFASTPREVGQIGQCDPVDGPRFIWTREARQETRRRVRATCRELGASRSVCAYLDAVVVRESSGAPGVRHRRGEDSDGVPEHGLGATGLSLRWQRGKWPGRADPDFCTPEVAAFVSWRVARSAVTRFGATDLVGVQSIYAGRWKCYKTDEGRRCWPSQTRNPPLCAALEARGHSCRALLTPKDFGPRRSSKKFMAMLVERGVLSRE